MLFIRDELQRVVRQYGEWTDHNIKVAPDIYTIGPRPVSPKLRRIVQIVSDLAGEDFSRLRVLDLGCLEGGYAVEFAMHGATVIAVEGREANIAKARVVRDLLHLDNLILFRDDIRNLSLEAWGSFNVVLCLGVLYHIDATALFSFTEQIATICTHLAIFDTEVSVRACTTYKHQEHIYSGREVIEHDPQSAPEERLQELWGSLDNQTSTWLTKPSLLNLLHRCGFSSAYECNVPIEPQKRDDRLTIVAIKGHRVNIKSVDELVTPTFSLPESHKKRLNPEQSTVYSIRRRLTLKVPRAVRATAKRFLRWIGLMSKSPRFWELPWQVRHTAGHPGHASELEPRINNTRQGH
jgi:SAM-dependent methyltransferase